MDGFLNIDNEYFEPMVITIYPKELQMYKTDISDTETPFWDSNLSIYNDIIFIILYDTCSNLDFVIVNDPFLDGDVPPATPYGVNISQ